MLEGGQRREKEREDKRGERRKRAVSLPAKLLRTATYSGWSKRERESILFLSGLQLSKGIADDEDLKRGLSLIKIFVIDREKIIVTVNENLHYY